MRRATTMLSAAAMAGCAPTLPAEPSPAAAAGRCDAGRVTEFVGKRADAATITAARDAAGTAVSRTLRPGAMVTMDYREDRLNLVLDAAGIIRGARCG